jgi:hypothetical protein
MLGRHLQPTICLFSRRAPASRSATRSCERMDERSSRSLNRFGGSPDEDAPSGGGACGGGVFFLARSGSTEPLTLRRITACDPGSLAGSPWICRDRFHTSDVNGGACPDPERLPSTGAPRGALAAPGEATWTSRETTHDAFSLGSPSPAPRRARARRSPLVPGSIHPSFRVEPGHDAPPTDFCSTIDSRTQSASYQSSFCKEQSRDESRAGRSRRDRGAASHEHTRDLPRSRS